MNSSYFLAWTNSINSFVNFVASSAEADNFLPCNQISCIPWCNLKLSYSELAWNVLFSPFSFLLKTAFSHNWGPDIVLPQTSTPNFLSVSVSSNTNIHVAHQIYLNQWHSARGLLKCQALVWLKRYNSSCSQISSN